MNTPWTERLIDIAVLVAFYDSSLLGHFWCDSQRAGRPFKFTITTHVTTRAPLVEIMGVALVGARQVPSRASCGKCHGKYHQHHVIVLSTRT